MKTNRTITLALCLLLGASYNATAGIISAATAQSVALNFFKNTAQGASGKSSLSAVLKYTKTGGKDVDFYVFDMNQPKGFVIVAADDNITPILAYSTESNFNGNESNGGIKNWMSNTSQQIQKIAENHIQADAHINSLWSAYKQGSKPASAKSNSVAPLLTTTWGQEGYYNQLCPYSQADNQTALTGCVATTMAQIMKFWNFPATGTGAYSYNDVQPAFNYNYGVQSANFGQTIYNWASMPDSLTSANTAVATLMYQCGVAVAMDYGDDNQGGSGSYVLASEVPSWKHSAEFAYKNYFSYNPTTLKGIHQSDYTVVAWIKTIEDELLAGRPVQYEGIDTIAGGHTWVCDGYDQNDMLHMNWGWNGLDNGYFNVANLSVAGFNFSTTEAALIGIQPQIAVSVNAIVSDSTICQGSSTTIRVQGPASATYSWYPATGINCATCVSTVASPDTTTTYTVTVAGKGYTATSSVTIHVNTAINLTNGAVQNVSCFGGANGSASVAASGGTGSYNFTWSNGQFAETAAKLTAGNYTLTVSDAAGCSASTAQAVSQPEPLKVSISTDNVAPGATITANVTGGTEAYSFVWSIGDNTASVANLNPGAYAVTVSDNHSCTATAGVVVVAQTTDTATAKQDSTVSNMSTGINNVENNSVAFTVYPNPAKNILNIKMGKVSSEVKLSLINVVGENLLNRSISSLDSQLDLSSYSTGLYFVSITIDGNTSVQQFIISR